MVARQPGSSPAMSKVCRCLFGKVDHADTKRVLDESNAVLAKQAADNWNFDFTTCTPQSGRYEWHPVTEGDENVPMAYSLSGMTPVSTTTAENGEVSCPPETDTRCDAKCETECSKDKQTSSDRCKIQRRSTSSTRRRIPGEPTVCALKVEVQTFIMCSLL